ncbi:MAG: hypothetical protein IPL12_19870 [Bacteroidetes bacterium]|nr:hypothetical protein [Bacteroidota bacterium]
MWGKEINGIGDEVITAVGTDAQNNIYAYGTFSSLTSFDNTDILPDSGKLNAFVVKYNPSGNYQFIKQFSSEFLYITEFPTDYESPFVVDAKGNIYLGGGFAGSLIYETDTLVSNSSPHLFYANGFLLN